MTDAISNENHKDFLEDDVAMLLQIGRSLPEEGRCVQVGGTSIYPLTVLYRGIFQAKLKQWKVFCVDSQAEQANKDTISRQLLRDRGIGSSIALLKMPVEVARQKFPDKSLNFILIDIDCGADPKKWKEKLSEGGRMFVFSSESIGNSEFHKLIRENRSSSQRVIELLNF